MDKLKYNVILSIFFKIIFTKFDKSILKSSFNFFNLF